ncbi:MAG: hypothetical protein H0T75_09800, partial [Rhizobiales bacterium]|nr:hypothetical protein [Hyphomicrobiales bacterium]
MRRSAIVSLGTMLLVAAMLGLRPAVAQDAAFSGGGLVGGDAYQYDAAPYALPYQTAIYEYATGQDGKGYYAVYDGQQWGSWQGWDDQTADYAYQPNAVVYNDWNYVFYTGKDGHIYHNGYDG